MLIPFTMRAPRSVASTLLSGLVAVAALTLTPTARAQEEEVDATLDAEARALFEAGQLAYQRGRFQNALEHFTRAYELSQRPKMLYNIGSAADRLRRDEEALEAFRKYLEAMPDAPNRAEVESRIEVLERTGTTATKTTEPEQVPPPTGEAAGNAVPGPEPATPEPDQEQMETGVDPAGAAAESAPPREEPGTSDGGPGAWPWVVAGTGVAMAGAGAVLLVVGQGQISNVEGAESGSEWKDFESDADTGPVLATTGVVLIGVGAAALAGGVIWLVASGGQSGETASVAVTPSGMVVRGRF